MPYRSMLSRTEFTSLGTGLTSTQGRKALQMINSAAGIQENQMIISESSASKKSRMQILYTEELEKEVQGPSGVMVYQTPTQAADTAIKRFQSDRNIQDEIRIQDRTRAKVEEILGRSGLTLSMPIEQIDVDQLKISSGDKANIRGPIDAYKQSIKRMGGQ